MAVVLPTVSPQGLQQEGREHRDRESCVEWASEGATGSWRETGQPSRKKPENQRHSLTRLSAFDLPLQPHWPNPTRTFDVTKVSLSGPRVRERKAGLGRKIR